MSPATFAWLFPLAFLLVGVMFIRISVRGRRSRRAFEQNAARTSGEVIDLRWESHTHASDHKRLAFPILRFSLPDGRTVETQANLGSNPPPAQPGAQVTVLYDAANPTNAALPTGTAYSVLNWALIGVGCLLILFGLAAAAGMALLSGL